MANRVIRDWTTSDKMDTLSAEAEVLFTRLIMKADDYGSFHSNPKLIKAALFPLKDFTSREIELWLKECINADLIGMYTVEDKTYIRIINFGQRLQNMRSAFPVPVGDFDKLTVTHGDSPPETKRSRNEVETETETNRVIVWPSFQDFWELYDKKQDRPKCELKWKKIDQGAREKIMEHLRHYVQSTPDRQFRKNPSTYLNNESWNNEIIIPNGVTTKQAAEHSLIEGFAKRAMQRNQGEQV